ncbi:MAG: LPO_1073/Vpar_1526 family protein [Betaproteobacteria bacterium]
MLNKGNEQIQQVGQGATAIQADGHVIINNGLSYSEVRSVVLDIFRSNFLQLADDAKEVARQRAEEITDKFLEKLQMENPAGLTQALTPDFQHGLFSVQRNFARNADTNLGDLLVDLLVDRTKHPSRDIVQIVLNECLEVAPKITNDQLSVLAIVFFFKYCSTHGILTFQQLSAQLDRFVKPFIDTLPRNLASYRHLEFAGCGTVQVTSSSLEDILLTSYQGLFDKGIDASELSGATFYFKVNQQLTGRCALDTSKIQVQAQNIAHLEKLIVAWSVSPGDAQRLRQAFGKNSLNAAESREKCIEQVPYMQNLFELWDNTPLNNLTLTSVGIGLAHANIKRLTGEFADLSIWMN